MRAGAVRPGLTRTTLLLLLGACSLAGCRTYDPAVFDERLRAAVFDTYWQALDDKYPFFATSGVDWDEMRRRYRTPVIEAQTRPEFYARLSAMLAHLNDAHVDLRVARPLRAAGVENVGQLPLKLARIERRFYVIDWPDGVAPRPPGAAGPVSRAYPELLSIDDEPCTFQFAAKMLLGPPGTTARLALRWPGGAISEEDLVRSEIVHLATHSVPEDAVDSASNDPPPHLGPDDWLIVQRGGEIGYMQLRSLSPRKVRDADLASLLQKFDAALDDLRDTRGLVLDLQYNTGGSAEFTIEIAGRFFAQPTLFGRFHYRLLGLFAMTSDSMVSPRPPLYAGRVVVLVNGYTGSAAEHLAWIFQRTGRGTLVGGTTFGAEAGVASVEGPDGSVLRFGRYPITAADGSGFQGRGITPDFEIPLTIDQVRRDGFEQASRDVALRRLERAVELLGGDPDAHQLRPPIAHGYFTTDLD